MKPLLALGPPGGEKKKKFCECLFISPSEVMLIMRNRRRRSLVCVEFKVCPTPSVVTSRH